MLLEAPTGVAFPLPDGVDEVVSSPIRVNAGFMRAAGAGEPSADADRGTSMGTMPGACSVLAEAKAVMSTLTIVELAPVSFVFPLPVLPAFAAFERAALSRTSSSCGTALLEESANENQVRNMEGTHPRLPTDNTMCAVPTFAWRFWNASFMLVGVSPLVIAARFFSSAIFFRRFSVFIFPLPLPWKR